MPELQNANEAALVSGPSGVKATRNQTRVVTTSWDDGDRADLKLMEILSQRAMSGTFYIPLTYRERPLSHYELKLLASHGFEIGAHGCAHKPLLELRGSELAQEVGPCKQILEDIIGSEVSMYCYARGKYNGNVVRSVRAAGYRGARTVRMLGTGSNFDSFEMHVSLQAFPHPPLTYLKSAVRARSLGAMQLWLTQMPRLRNWVDLGKALFDDVLANGGVWHLYGHSWEIDELGLWDDLCCLLDYVAGRDGVTYSTNGSLL